MDCPSNKDLELPARLHGASDFTHNASDLLCRLPEELLVCTLKLAQGRIPIAGAADTIPMDAEHDTLDWKHAEYLRWRHIMLVCRRLRDVAVRAPALWTLIATCWPARWLHVLCHVHTRAAAALAARLLAQARDAVLVLRDPTDVPADEWPALCAVLLATDARLRSLEVQVRGALLSTTSRPVPIAGALLGAAHGASLLTTLALERISLPSALLASPRLEHLRLHSVLPPPHLDWLKQWLRTAPRLRTLVLETDGPLAPASECVDPPHLARVGLEYLFDVVDAFFRTVPVPRESLVVGPYLGKSEESAPTLTPANAHSRRRSLPPTLTPTDAAGVRDLFSRIAEYWQRSHLKMEMPPCHVELRLAYPILVGLLMSTGIMHGGPRTPDTHDDDKLRVAVHMQHIRDLGPFMPFVTSCTITDATLSETPEWGTDALPNLEQLLTEVDGMVGFEDIRAFQRWADARARAGHAPIVVEVGTRRRLHPAANGTYHMLARWDTGAGLLSKARRRDMPEELDLDRDLECFN